MIGESFDTVYSQLPESLAGTSLSLLLSPRAFQYALFNPEMTEVRGICDVRIKDASAAQMTDQFGVLIAMHGLDALRFARTHVAVLGRDFALSPEAFVQESAAIKPLLHFSGGEQSNMSSASQHIANMEFCYALDLELTQLLGRSFGGPMIRHAGAVQLDLFFSHPDCAGCEVFAFVAEGTLALCLRKQGKLQLYNQFPAHTEEDILYFLLFACEQFGIVPSRSRLALAGNVIYDSSLHRSLKRFAGEVHFCESHPSFKIPASFDPQSGSRYFTLLNQHLCES